jgi:hypothetical protein
VKAEIWYGTLKGAKIALGDTELTKSLGFSLLLVGFPTLFANGIRSSVAGHSGWDARGGGDSLADTFAERRSLGRGHWRRNYLEVVRV